MTCIISGNHICNYIKYFTLPLCMLIYYRITICIEDEKTIYKSSITQNIDSQQPSFHFKISRTFFCMIYHLNKDRKDIFIPLEINNQISINLTCYFKTFSGAHTQTKENTIKSLSYYCILIIQIKRKAKVFFQVMILIIVELMAFKSLTNLTNTTVIST